MKYFIATLLLLAVSNFGISSAVGQERPLTTYERFLPFADAGDPAMQHIIGYMYFYGEGVDQNFEEAHRWFHEAAEEGDPRAQRNLGIFHARAIDRVPESYYDAVEANLWFSLAAANPLYSHYSPAAAEAYERFLPASTSVYDRFLPSLSPEKAKPKNIHPGKTVYQSSCAGCHGFDGYSAYPEAPSFAFGDRLNQSDAVLVESILEGRSNMPAWKHKLSEADVRQIVGYIRDELRLSDARPPNAEAAVDAAEASRLKLGEQVYLQFCGGCHGFNGIAWYVNSPSFALRERLEKSDEELANSIKNGIGAMPSWENMLPAQYFQPLVAFIRTLAPSYEKGLISELRRPDTYLQFKPKSETRPDWTGGDLR